MLRRYRRSWLFIAFSSDACLGLDPWPARVKKTRQKKNLVLAVVGGVVTARLDVMMFGVAGVAVVGMGVMCRFFMIAGLMMFGSFAVMAGGMLVMFGGLVMMLDMDVFTHVALPVSRLEVKTAYARRLTLC
jgi:hypothetical protein